MSGIVGSRFNIRGSGLVGSLGTDGQVFTSSGAGAGAVFEAAAGGGKILQVVNRDSATNTTVTDHVAFGATDVYCAITPTLDTSKIFVIPSGYADIYGTSEVCTRIRIRVYVDIAGGGYNVVSQFDYNAIQVQYQNVSDSGDEIIHGAWIVPNCLHDPATTSEVTYKVYIRKDIENLAGDHVKYGGVAATMTLMEVDDA